MTGCSSVAVARCGSITKVQTSVAEAHLALDDLCHDLAGVHAVKADNVAKHVPTVTVPAMTGVC